MEELELLQRENAALREALAWATIRPTIEVYESYYDRRCHRLSYTRIAEVIEFTQEWEGGLMHCETCDSKDCVHVQDLRSHLQR